MFRSRTLAGGGPLSGFSSKIAHTTRFPSLLGNQDLRALQDLITDEKGVVSGLQKLSLDWAKAADALRVWSLSEDDDLGDISTQAVAMLSHISQSLDQFALHEQSVRTHLKDIRSKEEGLDGLRRHRRVVDYRARNLEKKLIKMSPEHRGFQEQTELLAQLQREMRHLDTQIMTDETQLGDFKRQVLKEFLMLKFGSLLEFAEKAMIVGTVGKLLIKAIPLDTTNPGQPRTRYDAHRETRILAEEVTRRVREVKFDPSTTPVPAPVTPIQRSYPQSVTEPDGKNMPPYMYRQRAHTIYGVPVAEFGEALQAPTHRRYSTISGPSSAGNTSRQFQGPPVPRLHQLYAMGTALDSVPEVLVADAHPSSSLDSAQCEPNGSSRGISETKRDGATPAILSGDKAFTMRPYAPSRAPPMLDRIDFPIPPVTGDLNEANMTASRQPARGMDSRGLHADTSRHNICNGAPAWATRQVSSPSYQGSRQDPLSAMKASSLLEKQTEPYLPSQLFPPNFCLENAESPRNLPPWRDRRPYPLPPPAPNPTTRRRSRALPTPPGGNINSPSHHDSLGRYQRSLAHTTQSTYTHLQAQIDHWRDECVRQNLQDSPAWGYSIVDEAKGKSKEVDPLTDLSDHPLRNPTLANDYKLTVAPPDIIDFNCGPSHVASVSGSPFSIPCQATGATSAPNNLALHNPPIPPNATFEGVPAAYDDTQKRRFEHPRSLSRSLRRSRTLVPYEDEHEVALRTQNLMNDESRPLYRDQGKWNHAFREPEKIRKWNDVGGDTKGNEAIPDYQSPNTFHELFRNPAAAASWDRSVSLANGQPERTPAGPGPRIHENEAREVADRKLALQLALQDYETKREYDSLSAQYSPQEIFECSICMEAQPTEAAMSITTCKHVFCRMCLKFHVVARLEEGRHPIFCPICSADKNIDQKGEISITMAELLGLSERQFVMWEKLNLAQHSVWIDCPRCKRSSLVDRDDFQDSSELQCPLPTCRCVWCKKCMSQIDRAVGTHSCDGQAEMDRYIASGSATKRCPGCTTPTEKTGGCNHMTCSAPGCNTHFCWTCGKSIIRTRIQSQIQTAVEAHYGQCEFFHYN